MSEARAYLQRFQSPERRQPAASSSSTDSSDNVQHIPPIDTRTLSYSNDETSVDEDHYETNLQQVRSNESTLISEMTGVTGLSSPQNDDDDHDIEKGQGEQGALVVVTDANNEPTSWWRNVVTQLEYRHDVERKHWQENLQIAENKKSQYKSELRETIANQLKWLEDRMTSPTHMIPTSSSISSTSNEKWKQKASVLQELMQLTEQQHQVETSELQQKIQQLEATLDKTRDESTKQLETAFQHQQYMEGLVQQWKETADGAIGEQRKLQQAEKESKVQLKAVRDELEKERQQNTTSKSRENEMKRLQDTLAMERKRTEEAERKCRLLQSDMKSQAQKIAGDRSSDQIARLQTQIEELQEKCQQMNVDRQNDHDKHKTQVKHLQQELQTARDEANTFRAQAADFSEAATTAKSQCTTLQRSLAESPMGRPAAHHRIEWDDKLDRALAERDLYQQEAAALKSEQEKLVEQLQRSEEFVDQYEQLAEKHADLIERLAAFEHSSDQRMDASQLAAIQHENQCLQEALANEGDRHAQEVRKLKADLLQMESEAKLYKVQHQQGSTVNSGHEAELNCLRVKVKHTEAENEERGHQLSKQSQATIDSMNSRIYELEEQIKAHDAVQESDDRLSERLMERIKILEKELSNRPVAALQRLAELSEQHTRDQRGLMDQLDAAASENKDLQHQTKTLSKSLADLKNLHTKSLAKYDRLLVDKERLQRELEVLQEQRGRAHNAHENSPPDNGPIQYDLPDDHLIDALSGLQNDVRDLKQQLKVAAQQQSLEHSFLERFRSDLSNIQGSLNDAVVELTLETDALLESREAIKTVASDASSLMGERDGSSKSKLLEQQQKLLSEFGELRDNLNATASARSVENQAYLKELIDDIRSKEASLSASQTELQFVKEKLQSEIASRQKAESEIEMYAEQADAYEEQLMTLQSNNTRLVKKLHFAGLKIDASLSTMPSCDDEVNSAFATPRCLLKPSSQRDESLPVLDEAMALAENMSSLMRDGEQDGSFMDMLEAMSNLMETKNTIGVSSPVSPKRSYTPRGHRPNTSFDETVSERTLSTAPSSPVSPLKRHRKIFDDATGSVEIVHECLSEYQDERSSRATKLALVVEQLYARCQMLERERTEMMETTLDLLEATKEANTAEIDAVLAGARRRAVDDILEMHRSSKRDQERVLKRIMMDQKSNMS